MRACVYINYTTATDAITIMTGTTPHTAHTTPHTTHHTAHSTQHTAHSTHEFSRVSMRRKVIGLMCLVPSCS